MQPDSESLGSSPASADSESEAAIDAATIRSKFESRLESGDVREILPAQQAYELMVGKLEGNFEPWGELTDATRGAFKARAVQVQGLPIFEQCVAELLFSPQLS